MGSVLKLGNSDRDRLILPTMLYGKNAKLLSRGMSRRKLRGQRSLKILVNSKRHLVWIDELDESSIL